MLNFLLSLFYEHRKNTILNSSRRSKKRKRNEQNGLRMDKVKPNKSSLSVRKCDKGLRNRKRIQKKIIKLFVPIIFSIYYQTIPLFPRIDYSWKPNNSNDFITLKFGDLKLTLIPTPGHSDGHISVLDSRGNLFLGDMIPFTPWIEPSKYSVDSILKSIKNLLSLDNKIKRAIRSHGNPKKKKFIEISPWEEEKQRFMKFSKQIEATLQKIPLILQNGNSYNTRNLTKLIFPKSKKYSNLMSIFFFTPSISWMIAYCLKLEKDKKIRRIFREGEIFWTK